MALGSCRKPIRVSPGQGWSLLGNGAWGRAFTSPEDRYYIPSTLFDPPIVYPEPTSYGSIGAIAFQGVGIVALPLPVGEHIMRLYEPYIIADPPPGIGAFGVVYDNVWTITVTAH